MLVQQLARRPWKVRTTEDSEIGEGYRDVAVGPVHVAMRTMMPLAALGIHVDAVAPTLHNLDHDRTVRWI